jgi:hypothetical protein
MAANIGRANILLLAQDTANTGQVCKEQILEIMRRLGLFLNMAQLNDFLMFLGLSKSSTVVYLDFLNKVEQLSGCASKVSKGPTRKILYAISPIRFLQPVDARNKSTLSMSLPSWVGSMAFTSLHTQPASQEAQPLGVNTLPPYVTPRRLHSHPPKEGHAGGYTSADIGIGGSGDREVRQKQESESREESNLRRGAAQAELYQAGKEIFEETKKIVRRHWEAVSRESKRCSEV